MCSNRNVIVFADDINILVSGMRNDLDLRILEEKGGHDIAHGELHGGHGCSATDSAIRFVQSMTYGGLSEFRLA